MGLNWPPIPPNLQKIANSIDQKIIELQQKGPEKFMNDWIKSGKKVKPILDIQVLQLEKIGLGVMTSNNVLHHQMFHAEVWNKLLDVVYDKVRTETQLKKAHKKIEELEKN